jgi:hypothetical protein
MTHRHPTPSRKANSHSVAWALLSQSIWIPCFFADTQAWITSTKTDFDFSGTVNLPYQNLPASIAENPKLKPFAGVLAMSQNSNQNISGFVLNPSPPLSNNLKLSENKHFSPLSQNYIPAAFLPNPQPSVELSLLPKPLKPGSLQSQTGYTGLQTTDIIKKFFTRADLLGGILTLNDIHEPEMPAIARAEMAKLARSRDPLAVIPSSWRESMRKALSSLTSTPQGEDKYPTAKANGVSTILLEPARIVHVPSRKIKRQTEVPLALQPDGTVDILNQPDDPGVVEEIKSWSIKQQLPPQGRMTPAVVHLHPMVETEINSQTLEPKSQSIHPQPAGVLAEPSTRSEPAQDQTALSSAKPELKSTERTSAVPSESAPLKVAPPDVSPPASPVNESAQVLSPAETSSGVGTAVDSSSIGGLNP